MGCSCDWSRTRFTLDDMLARAVRQTFFKLFKDGLIYRGKRLVNWDVHLQTSISDDEIYNETVKTSLWHIQYPIEGDGQVRGRRHHAPRDDARRHRRGGALDDPRWNWAIGKRVTPAADEPLIPIIADDDPGRPEVRLRRGESDAGP